MSGLFGADARCEDESSSLLPETPSQKGRTADQIVINVLIVTAPSLLCGREHVGAETRDLSMT